METLLSSSEPVPEPIVLRRVAQTVLRRLAESSKAGETVRMHTVFDNDTDHYLLVAEGWQGYRRVYRTVAHVAVSGGRFEIYEDGTVEGVAEKLRAEGIPAESIVCAWTSSLGAGVSVSSVAPSE